MSVFDLDTDVKQLASSNGAITKMEYQQVTPTRDVTSNNFSNGAIHFKFSNSGVRRWIPSKTYLRTRIRLTKGNGDPIDTAFGAAPNMALCGNLFQSGEFRINDKVVSRVGDYLSQVDSLETRLTKSRSWLQSIGESSNWWSESQALRLAEVANDGKVVTNSTPVLPAETVEPDTSIGYDALNSVAYAAATGVVTFAAGGGAAVPNTDVNFAVGDFLILTAGTVGDGALNVKLEVLAVAAAATMTVRADIAADIGAANDIRFSRARPNENVAPDSRQVGSFELIWQPPLSIFKVEKALPCGDYEMVLNPQTFQTFQKRAIESILGAASIDSAPSSGGLATQIKCDIVDMFMYCAMVDGPRVDDLTYLLDLTQTRCQAQVINNPSFGQKNFDVSPSTYALTTAYQDARIGENTALSPAKFRSYEDTLTPATPQELKLTRAYLNYAGQNLPAPDADPSFVAGEDFTTQRYADSQLYSGAYYDAGGCETIQEWHERGAYYHYKIPRDATDRSTRVTVHQGFQAGTDIEHMRVLLFDHSMQVCRVSIQDGRVTNVELEDA